MRKVIILIVTMLFLPSTLWAADPIIGTWKLNIEKSKLQTIPKEQTETYRELADGRIELTYQNIEKDGSSTMVVGTYPIQGGLFKALKSDFPYSFVQTRIAQDEWLVTYLIDGKQFITRHKKISKDGKTLVQTIKGIDNHGQPIDVLLILERQ